MKGSDVYVTISFLSLIIIHFLETLSVGSSDEVCLHVVDPSLRIHQILLLLTFNLYHPHDNAIYHVDRLSFFVTFFFSIFTLILDVVLLLINFAIIAKLIAISCPLLIELLLWVNPQ